MTFTTPFRSECSHSRAGSHSGPPLFSGRLTGALSLCKQQCPRSRRPSLFRKTQSA